MEQLIVELELRSIMRTAIRNALKQSCNGTQDIIFKDDVMYIDFYVYGTPIFRYTEYDIMDKVVSGCTATQFAERAVKQYKKYVYKKYFR